MSKTLRGLASLALREASAGETMTTAGGAGTPLPKASSVLGAPASIIGSEFFSSLKAPILRFAPPRSPKNGRGFTRCSGA
jgi:hypothetical protein